jgi:hypothetical protein
MTYDIPYQLTNLLHGLRIHKPWGDAYVADGDETGSLFRAENLELESHIRSGDYFSLVATRLDDIASRLNQCDSLQQDEINKLVSDLLYVNNHYHLTRKS